VIGERPHGATRVVLVRHGEAAIAPGLICGRLDPPLSRQGRAHIGRVARWLAGLEVAAVYASPARRALQSARLLAAGRRVRVETVGTLREVDFGAFEGLTWEEATARDPATCAAWLARPHEVTFPGGEGFGDVWARAAAALRVLRERRAGQTSLVVAHAGVNRAILADALGMPPAAAFRIDQAPGAVNVLDWVDEAATVRLVNAAPELGPPSARADLPRALEDDDRTA
jgi:broad specificity phosphatase PhoE